MTETQRIQDQFHRARHGQAWHGPSLYELLADVTPAQAAAHPLADSHSIWELVNHLAAWESIALRRLQGESVRAIADGMNFPPVSDKSEPAWQTAQALLAVSESAVRAFVDGLTDERLDETVTGKAWTIYLELHGLIQHAIYHAG